VARFDLYANRNAAERRTLPFYLDVQAESLRHLATRVVIPLVVQSAFGPRIEYLHPVFEVQGKRLVLATTDIVGVEARLLGARAGNLAEHSFEIVSAIDYLLAGV
jgi:toxin CcdB